MVTEQQVEQTLKDHIKNEFMYDKPDIALENDLPLFKAGIIDSLGIFMLIAFMEEEFGVKIEPEDIVLENFQTINLMKRLVVGKQG